jgi:hypothetical protein
MLLQIIIWPVLAVCAALCCMLVCVALLTAFNLIRGRA